MLIFFFMLLGLAMYFVYKLIAPELNIRFNLSSIRLPWRRLHLKGDVIHTPHVTSIATEDRTAFRLKEDQDFGMSADDKLERLERMLNEKNIHLERLSVALDAERQHRIQFEKNQEVLQEEILRLKENLKQIKKGA